ncbi:voltage-gated potassium channel [Aureococcus anophagefferens]|nr:voltage-gated potassium channel [Aureococcus anophagefferens]
MQRLFALASPQGEAHAQVQGLELSACLLRCLRPREDPFAGSEGGDDADEACQEVFAAVALGRTCSPCQLAAARCCLSCARAGRPVDGAAILRKGLLLDLLRRNFYLGDGGALAFGSLAPYDARTVEPREAIVDAVALGRDALVAGADVPADALAEYVHAMALCAAPSGRRPLRRSRRRRSRSSRRATRPRGRPLPGAGRRARARRAARAAGAHAAAQRGRPGGASPKGGFDAVAPDTAREVDAKVHALRALATVAEADGDGAVAVARSSSRRARERAVAGAAARHPRLGPRRRGRGPARGGASTPPSAPSATPGAARSCSRRPRRCRRGRARRRHGRRGAARRERALLLLRGARPQDDADAALRSGAGDALADALHDAATPPACVVRLLDAFGRLAAPVARLEADLVPRVLLKRVVLTIRDKLLAAPPPDVARALCRALRDLAKADASGDALPFYLCTKWSCLAAVLVRSLSFVLDEALEALCAIAAVHPGAAQESEIPNVHPGDDPLLPSDGFAALGDLLEDRTPLLGDFGHLGFDDVDRQHECLRHLRENGTSPARDVAAHLLGARLFRRAEDAEATRILAALARGPRRRGPAWRSSSRSARCALVAVALLIKLAEDPAGVDAVAEAVEKFSKTLRSALACSKILQSKIVALYEDAKARRHKLDMREKRAEPSPADIAAAEARANRAAAELLEQLDEEATPPSKKKKKKKKKKKGHRDVAEAVAAEDAPADDKAEDGKAAAAPPPASATTTPPDSAAEPSRPGRAGARAGDAAEAAGERRDGRVPALPRATTTALVRRTSSAPSVVAAFGVAARTLPGVPGPVVTTMRIFL